MLLGVSLVNLGGLEGVDHLVLHAIRPNGEGALQLGDGLHGGAGLGILVHLELNHFLLLLDHHGHDLIVEAAGLHSGAGLLLGRGGELVQLLTGNAPDVTDVLSGGAHVVVVVGVPQAVLDHGIDHLLVTHAGAPALIRKGEGSLRHALRAAGYDDVSVATDDGPGGLHDRLHTGAAHHVDSEGGNTVGDTGLDHDLTGDVLPQASGEHAAEDDLVHVLGSHIGPLQGLLHDDSAHVHSGGVLQTSTKGTNSGTAAIHNVDISHGYLTSKLSNFLVSLCFPIHLLLGSIIYDCFQKCNRKVRRTSQISARWRYFLSF